MMIDNLFQLLHRAPQRWGCNRFVFCFLSFFPFDFLMIIIGFITALCCLGKDAGGEEEREEVVGCKKAAFRFFLGAKVLFF